MIPRFSVKRPYTVVVAVVLVLVLGYVSFTSMRTDLLPDMTLPYAIVYTAYPGASPEEVEVAVTRPVEQAMATISNIEHVTSVSSENVSTVVLEFSQSANMDAVTIEMREGLDQIKGYWDEKVGNPIIMKMNPDMMPVMVAAVDAGDMSSPELTDYVNQKILPEFESIEGVASVSASGTIEEEVQVILRQNKIDDLNRKITDALDDTFSDAQEKFDQAEKELDRGKEELDNGQKILAEQTGAAESQLSGAQGELIKNEVQLDQKLQEIATQLGLIETAKKELDAKLKELEGDTGQIETFSQQLKVLKQQKDQLEKALTALEEAPAQLRQLDAGIGAAEDGKAMESQIQQAQKKLDELKAARAKLLEELAKAGVKVTGDTESIVESIENKREELTAQKQQLDNSIALMEATVKAADSQNTGTSEGKQQIAEALKRMEESEEQLETAKVQLERAKAQIAAGKSTLSEALAELNSQKINAVIEVASGKAKLTGGEEQLLASKAELKAQKDMAYEKADVKTIVTADMVKGMLAAQNFTMPAGYVTEEGIDYLVRVGNKFPDTEGLEELVLMDMNMEGIAPIRLSDVADVVIADNSGDVYAKINGNAGILFNMQKQSGYSTGEVSGKIKEKFQELSALHENLHIVTLMDQGVYIDMVVNSVLQNMISGAILAILVLLLFLKSIRPTIVIAFSIPISILTAIVLMYFSGITLNIISLSGLALGIGMLVDNSIVVIENIYRLRGEGMSVKKAAVEGARQVSGAIAASTLTTICVFAPIVFAEGITRQLFVDMGLTIAFSLIASLAVALTVVPMMSAGLLKHTVEKKTPFFGKIQNAYGRILEKSLAYKPVVLAGAVALLGISGLLAVSRGTAFMPEMESTQVSVSMETAEGSTLQETGVIADQVMERILGIEDVSDVGVMNGNSGMGSFVGKSASNKLSIYVLLNEDKKLTNEALSKEILNRTEDLDCTLDVESSSMDMSALGGSGIQIKVKGRELDTLKEIAGEVAALLESVDGTAEVSDGIEEKTLEMRLAVKKEKAIEYQLTTAQVYQFLQAKLADAAASTVLGTDSKDYDVLVMNEADSKLTRDEIKQLKITGTNQEGKTEEIPLKDLVEFQDTEGFSSIQREAQTRYVNVSASVDDGYNIGLVSQKVEKKLADYRVPEGYTVETAGENETIQESMTEVFKMLALAVIFMYLIMVAQFQSLLSPFIIMFTIPLAFTGGLLGLFVTDNPVSVIAMIGFVMLSGIIVNNGIVLVDYINQLRRKGMEKKEAIIEAGRTRLRPIIMTALTTILGLSTMAIGFGMGADMVQPMAIVTIGGLTYGTLLTLVVVPCIYDMLNRKKDMMEEEI